MKARLIMLLGGLLTIAILSTASLMTAQAEAIIGERTPPTPAPHPDEGPTSKPGMTNGRIPDRLPVFVESSDPAVDIRRADQLQIDVWYGDEQSFGNLGQSAGWINVLGNVSGVNPITSLTYSLNNDPPRALAIGPNGYRLARSGDFNVELAHAELDSGANQVVITAQDGSGEVVTKTVTIQYQNNNVWPLPYTATWDASSTIQASAQVVDGKWVIEDGTVRPTELSYDRLISIGDYLWSDYEITVPMTVRAIDAQGYDGVNNGPGVGVLMRWPGHYQVGDESHPYTGWTDLGALAWYHWYVDQTEGLQMFGYGGYWLDTNADKTLQFDVPYMLKARVESRSGLPARYSFKMWPLSEVEPSNWDLDADGTVGGPVSGSMLLVSHWADVSFGQVIVTPLDGNAYTLTTNKTGNGFVTRSPDKDSYNYGEQVTLNSAPADGWKFKEWQGDVPANSTDVALELTMTGNKTVTAVFEEVPEYTLTVNTMGQGAVSQAPDQLSYTEDMTVTLTAAPAEGWAFKEWQGDVPTITVTPTLTLTMDSDKIVVAVFEEIPEYQLTVNVMGQGGVNKTPDQLTYRENMTVTLMATADEGWLFKEWQGDVPTIDESDTLTSTNVLTLTMASDKVVTAFFEEAPPSEYILSVDVTGQGNVNKSPDLLRYTENMTVTLTAMPDDGWIFKEWQGETSTDRTSATLTLTMDGDKALFAFFERLPHIFLPVVVNQ